MPFVTITLKVAARIFGFLLISFCGLISGADLNSSYSWQPVRIGAGGWADGIIINPTNPKVRYLRDDTGEAYYWDSTKAEWMPMGVKNADGSGLPIAASYHGEGINPRSFALDPNNSNIVYLYLMYGSGYSNGSMPFNVYKSTNGGRSFIATNFNTIAGFTLAANDVDVINVRNMGERLTVDPNNSNVVYIGTGNKGMFRSTDGGIN